MGITMLSMRLSKVVLALSVCLASTSPLPLTMNQTAGTRILIMGDSWGTVSPATDHFQAELKEHNCPLDGFTNIAIGGTTAKQWASSGLFGHMNKVKKEAKVHDHIWITLMGNDALAEMPDCASAGKTASECGDVMMKDALQNMGTILDGIHEANPNAKVVGFGYDTMFGGLGCSLITHQLFPQCWKNKTESNPIRCFNTQLIRMQEAWETLAKTRPYVHPVNLLGTTQVAAGDAKAAIGKPNLDKMGPRQYWPDTLGCIHPSTTGGDKSGAMIIMEEFYKQYWSKALSC